jgi:nitroreductase
MKLNLSADEVLTTTRAVRKRLDLTKPVPRAVLEECLEIALQAPNGTNRNPWHFMIVDDPALIAKLAASYKGAMDDVSKVMTGQKQGIPREDEMMDSAFSLSTFLDKVPVMMIPMLVGRYEKRSLAEQAAMWGSIAPAAWSFCLAARERGIGTCWTTVGLVREREMAETLGIPYDKYMQVGLFPVAYTKGTDFKKAWRKPVSEVLSYNTF